MSRMCRQTTYGYLRNLVLLGDQMQLGQPIQGSHPGESGSSVLEYLLRDQATIPEDLGIFLAMTWRLHPGICEFISGAVYEDRLQPEEHTKDRIVHLPDHAELVPKEAGIVFLPVTHEGNTQKSEEEAEVIAAAVGELLAGEWSPEAGRSRPITLDDILFVAPYNMQVRHLKQVLPDGARVGSVDKFQGREAPIVFVSMCASPGEAAPRGMEFLLNRNRLNVAISRAKSLAIVVGDPGLTHAHCSSVTDMERLNLYCRLLESGAPAVEPPGGINI
jgi:superfamily I DNA and/or RNA helicase